MVSLASWLNCSTTTARTKLVKIVYPGGRVEFHDRPVLASEITQNFPKCCVAHPDVFRQPWEAVVAPNTVLDKGKKFYVIPISTLTKLRMAYRMNNILNGSSSRCSLSSSPGSDKGLRKGGACLLLLSPKSEVNSDSNSKSSRSSSSTEEKKGEVRPAASGCFTISVFRRTKSADEDGASCGMMVFKDSRKSRTRSPSPTSLSYQWQPSLSRIIEEQSEISDMHSH